MTVTAAAFLSSFEFQRKETVAGYITSSKGVIAPRAINGGLLSELFVDIGDFVNAGDPLFTASTDVESTAGKTRDRQIAISSDALDELSRQTALVSETFITRQERLQTRRQALRSGIEKLREQLRLNQEILELSELDLKRIRSLNEKRHASDNEVTRQLERVLERRADLAALQSGIAERQNDVRDIDLELGGLQIAEARDLSDLSVRRNSLLQARLEQRAQRGYLVRSPVSGRVSAIQGHVGQELTPQAAVVTILPTGAQLIATLLAPSRAAGFLELNGSVNLLIDAFPYQKFGVQRGRIREIARTAHNPRALELPFAYDDAAYKLVVELDQDYVIAYGQRYPLQVDMTLRGDLIVDRRTLLDWLLEPLQAVRL